MIQVKEMMQDNDLKNSKSKDKGSKSRSQSMDEQSHYKQDKTITRQSINVKRHIFNVIGGTEEFEERDLNIGGDCSKPNTERAKEKLLAQESCASQLKKDEELVTRTGRLLRQLTEEILFDYLLEEFSGELAHIDPIPPGIVNTDLEPEEEICLIENLLYENSSPEERDIRFLEELLNNDSFSLPENESSNLDHFNDPSSSRPPSKPPDVEICFDFEPDEGIVTTKVVKGISEHYVLMPNILPTLPTFDPDLDFTPSHDSLGSENTIFDLGIFIEF
ncbi:hypothetical protein Tco_1569284 [Tanacetum coccineum]